MSSTAIPKWHITLSSGIARVFSFPLEDSSQRVKESYNRLPWCEIVNHLGYDGINVSLIPSITSISASSSGRVFFYARREKSPPIFLAVRKSSLWNILVPLISLACIIDWATDAGSAFCPVISPSLNFLVRYDLCASVNLRRGPVTFRAQPISRFCVLACLVGTFKTGTIVVPCPSSCSAYWTAALSHKVSCSRVYWCLPQS